MAHELLLRGYLKTTGDEYRLVKLTERSEEVLSGERFFMKMAKVEPASGGRRKGKRKGKKEKGSGRRDGRAGGDAAGFWSGRA